MFIENMKAADLPKQTIIMIQPLEDSKICISSSNEIILFIV